MSRCDVAIIGAGPYGLSAAAHLRTVKGLDVRVFGRPMSFWHDSMPSGMLLRSNWTATQIAAPAGSLTIEAFCAATARRLATPVPIDDFVRYGLWYQTQAASDIDQRNVARVSFEKDRFRIALEDGEELPSRRVIVAAGIAPFAWCPIAFRCLQVPLASHTSAHRDFRQFAGRRVIVIGGGQSALESAALLREAGASVEVIVRSRQIHWLQGPLSRTLHHGLGKLTRRILYAPTDVGPAGLSQLMARPDLLRTLPRQLQDRLRRRCVRPAGARWLVDRLEGLPMRLGTSAVSALPIPGGVRLKLDNGIDCAAQHVLLGTGYRVDIAKYDFFDQRLLGAIRRHDGYPILGQGFETSVPGLHILGAPAAWSYGPLLQFVSGTGYASRALLRMFTGKPALTTSGERPCASATGDLA